MLIELVLVNVYQMCFHAKLKSGNHTRVVGSDVTREQIYWFIYKWLAVDMTYLM